MASSSATPIQKGNYQRRKPGERSRTGETSALNNAGVREEDQATNDTSNPNQFIGQEDFISFDFSPSPPPPGGNSSRGNQRDHRGSTSAGDHRSGSKRKHDDEEDVKQEEGTRQLRKREKERSTPWCDEPGVSWSSYDNATSQLNAEAKSFISYISPTPVEHELRMWTIEIIRRTIKSKYSDADVQCFGSVGTGLYLPGGDIDLVVLCPSMPSPPLKPSSSLLHRLASLLLTSSIAQPSSLVVIAKARVPIVKFTTRYGGFAVDLSVNQKNGVDAAVRVRGMLEDFAFREEGYVEPGGGAGMSIKGKAGKGKEKEKETTKAKEEEVEVNSVDHGAARSMVLLVKAFLAQRGMNEVFTGGLGSYSIICLVISFLQLHPRIQSAQIQPSRNIGLLFLEFLEYYGKHFNFDEAGITLKGRGGYFNKHDKGWFRGNQPYLLSIEDPNDPQNDVSGGSHNIIRVRQTLAGGFDTLSATLLQRQSLLSSQRNPSLIPLSSSSLPNADSDPPSSSTRSLLGSIIGMTRAGVDARGANVRLWDDGVLQSILDRIGGGGDGMFEGGGKKAMKRARKEERERERREKTIAKLERRVEEKEKRASRKKEKKRGRQEGDDGDGIETEQVTPVVDPRAVVEAQATAAKLKGLAGPDEDSEFTRKGDMVDEEEEGSRYSLGVPTIAKRARKVSPQPRRPIYSADASSDSSNDSGQEDQDDVVLGGGGGDFVRFDSAQHSEDDQDDDENDSGSDSSEEVLQSLVPASSRFRINGAAAEKKKEEEAEGAEELERTREPPKKKKSGANSEAKKKAKAASRIAFWGAKGPKE